MNKLQVDISNVKNLKERKLGNNNKIKTNFEKRYNLGAKIIKKSKNNKIKMAISKKVMKVEQIDFNKISSSSILH